MEQWSSTEPCLLTYVPAGFGKNNDLNLPFWCAAVWMVSAGMVVSKKGWRMCLPDCTACPVTLLTSRHLNIWLAQVHQGQGPGAFQLPDWSGASHQGLGECV